MTTTTLLDSPADVTAITSRMTAPHIGSLIATLEVQVADMVRDRDTATCSFSIAVLTHRIAEAMRTAAQLREHLAPDYAACPECGAPGCCDRGCTSLLDDYESA